MTTARGWWQRHGVTVALVGVVLAGGVGLGLSAPSTSPVNVGWRSAPAPDPGP